MALGRFVAALRGGGKVAAENLMPVVAIGGPHSNGTDLDTIAACASGLKKRGYQRAMVEYLTGEGRLPSTMSEVIAHARRYHEHFKEPLMGNPLFREVIERRGT